MVFAFYLADAHAVLPIPQLSPFLPCLAMFGMGFPVRDRLERFPVAYRNAYRIPRMLDPEETLRLYQQMEESDPVGGGP